MKAPPPLSVLLPVRDGGVHLDEAIDSLEQQSFGEFEVLAVDDGSTDDSLEKLRAWASRDARVTVIEQAAQGIVAALEAGRALARGRYLARMDADDVSAPTRFARQYEWMESRSELSLCGCRVEYFPREHVRGGALWYEAWINSTSTREEVAREIFVECPIAHPTFFMRAEAVAAVGGYQERGWPEDYDLVFRLWRAGGGLGVVPEKLLSWREGEGRLSRTDPRYSPNAFRRCKAHYLLEAFPRLAEGALIWGAGPVGKALARELVERGAKLSAFAEVNPRKIGQQIYGAPVLGTAQALANREVLHLGAVGQKGAREQLRSLLSEAGLEELKSFVLMA
jgi:GT2 family glycosyltransferase